MTEARIVPEITDDFAKMFEDYFVPSIFAQGAHHLVEIAAIELGHRVLDVACGTGVMTRAAELEVGLSGEVIGLDHNEQMLAIARTKPSRIDWQRGDAAELPFADKSFDRVLCQLALMFISNRVAVIKEMLRVCKPEGKLVVSVWAQLSQSTVYTALVNLVNKYAGSRAAFRLASPWSLGVPGNMDAMLLSVGVREYECHERVGVARFPSVESFVEVHLRTAGEFHQLAAEDLTRMMHAAAYELAPFVTSQGELVAELDANIYLVNPG